MQCHFIRINNVPTDSNNKSLMAIINLMNDRKLKNVANQKIVEGGPIV